MSPFYITKLENIIRRIFRSINTIEAQEIQVQFLGEKSFVNEEIDQRCFKFQKNNSDFLYFELLIPTSDTKAHGIQLEEFMNQIMYKFNVENIACYLHDGKETDQDHLSNFHKPFIFEVTCITPEMSHKVYVNVDPEEFFN